MAEVRGSLQTGTHVASGNLDGSQFTFVRGLAGVNNDVLTIATTGGLFVGVLQNKPQNNEHATVGYRGITKVKLASSLGAGIFVMAGNSGWAVQATSGAYVAGPLISNGTSGTVAELHLLGPVYTANSL